MSNGISYTRISSIRASRITIRLDVNNQVVVTAPPRVSNSQISQFVESAKDWIAEQRLKQSTKPKLISTEHAYYFGNEYDLKLSNKMDGSVRIYQDSLILAPAIHSSKAALRLLEIWLRARAEEYIAKRTHSLSEIMNLPFNGMAFKQQKTRWGSCSSTKHLNFNWKLIHAPKEVIDYVIIHELAHTKHMNHGKQFWDLVALFDPDHPHHRRWLQRFGSTED